MCLAATISRANFNVPFAMTPFGPTPTSGESFDLESASKYRRSRRGGCHPTDRALGRLNGIEVGKLESADSERLTTAPTRLDEVGLLAFPNRLWDRRLAGLFRDARVVRPVEPNAIGDSNYTDAHREARIERELLDKPHTQGRRIPVRTIIERVEGQGLQAQTVADRHDLDISEVSAALLYYHDHPDEFGDLQRERAELVELLETSIDPPDDVNPPTAWMRRAFFGDANLDPRVATPLEDAGYRAEYSEYVLARTPTRRGHPSPCTGGSAGGYHC